MSTTEAASELNDSSSDPLDDNFEYRPLSSGAIAASIFGVLGLLTFAAGNVSLQSTLMLCPIPLLGLVIGLKALSSIRSMPDQISGNKLALAGVVLSATGLFGGLSFASYVHATEVPDGYIRTSFFEFRPDEIEVRSNVVVPDDIQNLDGKRVFIKGYIRPGTTVTKEGSPMSHHVGRFLLVRDNNECCFGDQSKVKYYDQMLVTLTGTRTTDDSRKLVRVGGILRSEAAHLMRRDGLPVYTLEADYLK